MKMVHEEKRCPETQSFTRIQTYLKTLDYKVVMLANKPQS